MYVLWVPSSCCRSSSKNCTWFDPENTATLGGVEYFDDRNEALSIRYFVDSLACQQTTLRYIRHTMMRTQHVQCGQLLLVLYLLHSLY